MFKNESLLRKLYRNYISKHRSVSYSQEGEDRILARVFEGKKIGFYVDVGAHHPFRFSNTYLFYTQGWRGINIEANPDALPLFEKFRPKDLNLNIAVGIDGQHLDYFKFEEPALNSFDSDLSASRLKLGWKMSGKTTIPMQSLQNILEKYLPNGQKIDYMTIDVEGLDFEVLKSNNWLKYRPTYLLVECLSRTDLFNDPIYKFLTEKQKYSFFAKAVNTVIFKNSEL